MMYLIGALPNRQASAEFTRRLHFERRVRVNFVEVLEGLGQLAHHRARIPAVHATDVVALEGVDEALSHAVALRAADGRSDGLQSKFLGHLLRVAGDVGPTVVRQELQAMPFGYCQRPQ